MQNETGDIFEMLITSLDDSNNETERDTGRVAYRLGRFTLHAEKNSDSPIQMMEYDFYKHFTFIGFINN